MKEHKRKYNFETEVQVPGIEEIVRVATDFSDVRESADKTNPKKNVSDIPSGEPKLDNKMSSIRNQMLKLAEAVAEDDQAVLKQIKEVRGQEEAKVPDNDDVLISDSEDDETPEPEEENPDITEE